MVQNFKEDETTSAAMLLIYKKHSLFLNDKLEIYGVSSGLYPIIRELNEHDKLSQSELAETFYLNKSTMTRNIEKLERKGLVEKIRDKNMKRISLTFRGQRVANEIREYEKEWDDKIKNILNENEFEEYKRISIKIAEKLVENELNDEF